MTLPGLPPPHAESKEATRRARAFLSTAVRTDWEFPKVESTKQTDTHDFASRGEVAWTQRRYSSCDETPEPGGRSPPTPARTGSSRGRNPVQRDNTRSKRQARLRAELLQECSTNVGLAHWCVQRDAWTRAKIGSTEGERMSTSPGQGGSTSLEFSAEDEQAMLLPIPQPILQDHPLRARVDKNAYGEIYSKVIVQGRTPSIPINLTHVTNALVHGWKAEGNWPPKDSLAETVVGKKKATKDTEGHGRNPLRKGVQAIGRAFRSGT